jgi:hypothetical protein
MNVYAQTINCVNVYAQTINCVNVYAETINCVNVYVQTINCVNVYAQTINCVNVYVHKVLREVFRTEMNEGIGERTLLHRGTRWRSWLRHCAKSRKVAGSIPDGVSNIILPAALWLWVLTQPLTEMSTRNISWRIKVAGA